MFTGIINRLRPVWNIGFVDPEAILRPEKLKIRWMKHHIKGRWWADPFILDVTDRHIILLVEEFVIKTQKGHISQLTVDKNDYSLIESKIILELDSHLSFPFILRRGKEIFVVPENAESGKSIIYKYDKDAIALQPLHTVCDAPLADAVIAEIDGRWLLISTESPNPNGNELTIREFDIDTLKARSIISTLRFDANIARNGGDIFQKDGKIYRVAQDCSNGYGKGIIIQQIHPTNNKGGHNFNEVSRHYPTDKKYHLGIHTFNSYKEGGVVDARGFGSKPIGSIVSLIPEKAFQKAVSAFL